MNLVTIRSAALFALASVGVAQAQDIITTAGADWRGFFVGANIGGAWNHTCQSWDPGPGITGNPALANRVLQSRLPQQRQFHWWRRSRLQLSTRPVGVGPEGRLRCRRQQEL